MYNFSFICRASKIDKKGFAPIELSIIINGTRTYVILPTRLENYISPIFAFALLTRMFPFDFIKIFSNLFAGSKK